MYKIIITLLLSIIPAQALSATLAQRIAAHYLLIRHIKTHIKNNQHSIYVTCHINCEKGCHQICQTPPDTSLRK